MTTCGHGCYFCRGLCRRCYYRAYETGCHIDHDRRTWPADMLLDEWVRLRDDGYTVRLAAERLGLSRDGLRQALLRARRRGDARGFTGAFGRVAA